MRLRIFAIFISLLILFSLLPSLAFAKDTNNQIDSVITVDEQPLTVDISLETSATTKNGLVKSGGEWKYFENGKFKDAIGLVRRLSDRKWFYVEKGALKKYTGLTAHGSKLLYIENGRINSSFSGRIYGRDEVVYDVKKGVAKEKRSFTRSEQVNIATSIGVPSGLFTGPLDTQPTIGQSDP